MILVPNLNFKIEIRKAFIELKKDLVLPKIISINNVFNIPFEKINDEIFNLTLESLDTIPRAIEFAKEQASQKNKLLYKCLADYNHVTLVKLPSTDKDLVEFVQNLEFGYIINLDTIFEED